MEWLDLGFGISNLEFGIWNLEFKASHFFKNTEYPDMLFPNVLKKIGDT